MAVARGSIWTLIILSLLTFAVISIIISLNYFSRYSYYHGPAAVVYSGFRGQEPVEDIIYNRSGEYNSDRSVFVIPRRAFFDTRIVQGKQLNQVVVLAEVHDDATQSIIACEIGGYVSVYVQVETQDAKWIRKNEKGYTHRHQLIWCAGLPEESIVNNSIVRLIYRRIDEDFYSRVEAEMPLHLPNHKDNDPLTFDRGNGSVVVCSNVFGHPPLFDQWLKYQQTLKVDMVHLSVDISFYENATELYPFLKQALETGFVQMHLWYDILNNRTFYNYQLVKYQDCLYRYIGVFEFAFTSDVDEFVVPVLAEHKDVHFYLQNYFADSQVGSLYFSWRRMKCKPIPEKIKALSDGNLTSILSGTTSAWFPNTKCAYRLNGVKVTKVHEPQKLLPGFTTIWTYKEEIYIAHLRNSAILCS